MNLYGGRRQGRMPVRRGTVLAVGWSICAAGCGAYAAAVGVPAGEPLWELLWGLRLILQMRLLLPGRKCLPFQGVPGLLLAGVLGGLWDLQAVLFPCPEGWMFPGGWGIV